MTIEQIIWATFIIHAIEWLALLMFAVFVVVLFGRGHITGWWENRRRK